MTRLRPLAWTALVGMLAQLAPSVGLGDEEIPLADPVSAGRFEARESGFPWAYVGAGLGLTLGISSGVLLKQRADDRYDEYLQSADPEEARRHFDAAQRYDRVTVVGWVIAEASAVALFYLITREEERPLVPTTGEPLIRAREDGLEVGFRLHPMKPRVAARLLWTLVLLAAAACDTRDPLNPLDPENPDTGGRPRWLAALADDRAVDLTWDVPPFTDLVRVRLLRADTGDLLWSGDPGAGAYRDSGLVNGDTTSYRLELDLTGGTTLTLSEEAATPGDAVPWMVDASSDRIRRITPDGRRVRLTVDTPGSAVIADPETGGVLVLDGFEGTALRLDRDGDPLWRVEDLERPFAGLRTAAGWWIGDAGTGVVFLLDDAGDLVFADSSFVFPVDIAPSNADLWVADRSRGLVKLALEGPDTLGTGPAALVSPTADGGAWYLDTGDGAIVRVSAEGTEVLHLPGYFGAADLEPDPLLGNGVWVADAFRGRLSLIDEAGEPRAFVGSDLYPEAFDVSPDGQVIWVADAARGILRYRRDGVFLGRAEGTGSALSVSVAFTPES